jgi:mannose-6-phosphate isomerase-like protein (cupin superfamily)
MDTTVRAALSPRQLAAEARALAARPAEWVSRVRLSAEGRWYARLRTDADHEVWLISWLPGQETGFHDHGGSAGAFAIAWGTLEERTPGQTAVIGGGQARAFGPQFVHNVRNASSSLAVSVHAYSPPLTEMARYEVTPGGLVVTGTEGAQGW